MARAVESERAPDYGPVYRAARTGAKRGTPAREDTHGLAQDFPGAEYDPDEVELIRAMDEWQRRHGVRFPTFSDVLGVVKSLGYRKQQPLRGRGRLDVGVDAGAPEDGPAPGVPSED